MYFISGNSGKIREVRDILGDIQTLDIDLIEIQEIDAKEVICHKLQEASLVQKGEILIEDTSLYCEGLGDLPGPLIKWFLKSLSLNQLAQLVIQTGNCKARAKTIFGYQSDQGERHYFAGEIEGKIVLPRGENGFGWDSIFEVAQTGRTFAEMDLTEKQQYSMRQIALRKLKAALKS